MCRNIKKHCTFFLCLSSIYIINEFFIYNVYGRASERICINIYMHTPIQWPPGARVTLADVLGFGSKTIAKMPLSAAQNNPITNIGKFPPFPKASSIGPLVREIMICICRGPFQSQVNTYSFCEYFYTQFCACSIFLYKNSVLRSVFIFFTITFHQRNFLCLFHTNSHVYVRPCYVMVQDYKGRPIENQTKLKVTL